MKNQIMEYDRHVGMNRKYGAVRLQTLKHYPVTVSQNLFLYLTFLFLQFEFVEEKTTEKKFEVFLIIDSRAFENVINVENIEEFSEKADGKLNLVYYIPDSKVPQGNE